MAHFPRYPTAIRRPGELDREQHWRTDEENVRYWLEQIHNAQEAQKPYFHAAIAAWDAYRNEGADLTSMGLWDGRAGMGALHPLNLYHSNIEAVKSHVFSQEPLPRVRRRRGRMSSAERVAADMLQKTLVAMLDSPHLGSTNKTLSRVRNDFLIAGRGMCSVTYRRFGAPRVPDPVPVFRYTANDPWMTETREVVESALVEPPPPSDPERPEDLSDLRRDENGYLLQGVYRETLAVTNQGPAQEAVVVEYVSPLDVLFQPVRRWEDVQWAAHVVFPTRDELVEKWGAEVADRARYTRWSVFDASAEAGADAPASDDHDDRSGGRTSDAIPRAKLWKIYDRRNARVIWLAEEPSEAEKTGRRGDHPLEGQGPPPMPGVVLRYEAGERHLHSFFPFPEPVQTGASNETLNPVPEFRQYELIFWHIQTTIVRFLNAIASLRVVAFVNAKDADALADALKETQGTARVVSLSEHGGQVNANQAITWMPVAEIMNAASGFERTLQRLMDLLYQVSGVSDVLRGVSQPRESATAQQHKVQFGLGSIGDKRRQMAEFCKEMLRMMVEIICGRFDMESILAISGFELRRQQEIDAEAAALGQQAQAMVAEQAAARDAMAGAQASQAAEATRERQMPDPAALAQMEARLRELGKEPSLEAVRDVIRNDFMRYFAIDVETDSTVVVDQQAEAHNRNELVNALSQIFSTFPPMVDLGIMPKPFLRQMVISYLQGNPGSRELIHQLESFEPGPEPPPPPPPEQIKAESDQTIAQMRFNHDADQGERAREHEHQLELLKAFTTLAKEDIGKFKAWLPFLKDVYGADSKQQLEYQRIVADMEKEQMKLESAERTAKMQADAAEKAAAKKAAATPAAAGGA